jgi:Protein kinase domain
MSEHDRDLARLQAIMVEFGGEAPFWLGWAMGELAGELQVWVRFLAAAHPGLQRDLESIDQADALAAISLALEATNYAVPVEEPVAPREPEDLTDLLFQHAADEAPERGPPAAAPPSPAVSHGPLGVGSYSLAYLARTPVPGPPEPPAPAADAARNDELYRAALRRGDWAAALVYLEGALALDPARFQPFPAGEYQPCRLLAARDTGETFLCRQRRTGRWVVVEALHPEALARPVREVFQELHAVRELDHPGILRVLDFGHAGPDESRPYQVQEYVEGMSLAHLVRQTGALSADAFFDLALQLAGVLRVVHERGIVHRDLKPRNVLLTQAGPAWQVKVLDFGLAARTPESGPMGTSAYTAPEQLPGEPPGTVASPSVDVYSFGRLCYYALAGTPTPDAAQQGRLPPFWRDLLEDCTARQPARRPADGGALERALRRYRDVVPGAQPQRPAGVRECVARCLFELFKELEIVLPGDNEAHEATLLLDHLAGPEAVEHFRRLVDWLEQGRARRRDEEPSALDRVLRWLAPELLPDAEAAANTQLSFRLFLRARFKRYAEDHGWHPEGRRYPDLDAAFDHLTRERIGELARAALQECESHAATDPEEGSMELLEGLKLAYREFAVVGAGAATAPGRHSASSLKR